MRGIGTGADDADLVLVAGCFEPGITSPAIGVDGGSGYDRVANEGQQAVRRYVLDPAQSDAADALAALLGCNRDNGFALDLSAPFVLFRAANIGFVDLDRSPLSASRPGRTMARRSLCSQAQAVS